MAFCLNRRYVTKKCLLAHDHRTIKSQSACCRAARPAWATESGSGPHPERTQSFAVTTGVTDWLLHLGS